MAKSIVLTCPYCLQSLQADDTIFNNKVECPQCGQEFMIDANGQCQKIDNLVVKCPICSNELDVNPESAGEKCACPFCGQHFILDLPGNDADQIEPDAAVDENVFAGDGTPAPPTARDMHPDYSEPAAEEVPGAEFSPVNAFFNISILGIVICFTVFCGFKCVQRWTTGRKTAVEVTASANCESYLDQAAKACCFYAQEHDNRLPAAGNWQDVVKQHVTKKPPCQEHYRYEGAGKSIPSKINDDNDFPLIVCEKHDTVVFASGKCKSKGDEK